MRSLVVLGAGTAGTTVANTLRGRLDPRDWSIVVVDKAEHHVYQPGLLHVPFGMVRPGALVRRHRSLLHEGVELVVDAVDTVDVDRHQVRLSPHRHLSYDTLVVASGTSVRPDLTPGMLSPLWHRSVIDFYTPSGAEALGRALHQLRGGRVVVHVAEMPVKCPVAALEMTFLLDAYFRRRGIREAVDLTYATPLDGAFTKPVASQLLGGMLAERNIRLEHDFVVERVDEDERALVSYDERSIPFDLLVTVPVNAGAEFVARSGLGDELNYIPVDRETFQSRHAEDVYVLGDANDIPTSKAGSVAHLSAEVFADNFVAQLHGRPAPRRFDGHATCFLESGGGKGLLLDFDYDSEPLPGRYPLPVVGPFSMLRETRMNHWGKLGFRWAYWNLLLPGRPLPVPRGSRSHVSHAASQHAGEKV